MAPAQKRGQLPRAAWHICARPPATAPPPELEAEGLRLVSDLAKLWSSKYAHHITSTGPKDGAYHFECIFSQPLDDTPVPRSVVYTYFALLLPLDEDKENVGPPMPRLLFSFEESDLRHEWKLRRGADSRLHLSEGPQEMSLRNGFFEEFMDKQIVEKDKMNSRGIDLVTSFESTRLPCPDDLDDCISEHDENESCDSEGPERSKFDASVSGSVMRPEPTSAQEMEAEALKQALREAGLACESVPVPSSLTELLGNVFDAADEEDTGELSHYEVSRLLNATLSGMGLRPWDIQLLMTAAQENTYGYIELKPFALQAPEIIQELRRRRLAYASRGYPKAEVSSEAVKHCYGAELAETADALMAIISQRAQDEPSCVKGSVPEPVAQGSGGQKGSRSRMTTASTQGFDSEMLSSPEGDGGLFRFGIRRSECRECILSLPTRISPQEANRLLQMLPEDEDCFLGVDTLEEQLEELRTGALHNCLVESDPLSLRKHLVINFRHAGITEEGALKVWQLRHALLAADQVCLSRLQIHMLLCLATPYTDLEGNVDVRSFSALIGAVIPHMLDAGVFVEIAERLQLEAAELQRMRENAELAALGASKLNAGDEEKKTQEVEVDQETVEKILIQALGEGRGPTMLLPEGLFAALYAGDQQIQSCQLSDFEIGGLAAEMSVDAKGEVAYVDHIKRTVPMIFELRRSQLLSHYVQPDGLATLGITVPSADEADSIFPLVPQSAKKDSEAIGSGKRKSSKRRTKESTGNSSLKVRATLSSAPEAGRRGSVGKAGVPSIVNGRGYERRRILTEARQATEEGLVSAAVPEAPKSGRASMSHRSSA